MLANAHCARCRAALLRQQRFQRVTPYKTVTGVTARYQQVMPRKEEDTPSSSISSSVFPPGIADRDDGDLVLFSRAYRLSCTPEISLTTARIHVRGPPGINARGSTTLLFGAHQWNTGGNRVLGKTVSARDESFENSFDRFDNFSGRDYLIVLLAIVPARSFHSREHSGCKVNRLTWARDRLATCDDRVFSSMRWILTRWAIFKSLAAISKYPYNATIESYDATIAGSINLRNLYDTPTSFVFNNRFGY